MSVGLAVVCLVKCLPVPLTAVLNLPVRKHPEIFAILVINGHETTTLITQKDFSCPLVVKLVIVHVMDIQKDNEGHKCHKFDNQR